jgi:hypothetical protein
LTTRRALAAAAIVLVSLVGLVAGGALLARRAVSNALERHGVEAQVALHPDGVTLSALSGTRSRYAFACDTVRVTASPFALLAGPGGATVEVDAGTCTLTEVRRGADTEVTPDAAPVTTTTSLRPVLDAFDRVEALEVDVIELDGRFGSLPAPIAARMTNVRRPRGEAAVRADVEVSAPIAWSSPVRVTVEDGRVAVTEAAPVPLRRWTLAFDELALDDTPTVSLSRPVLTGPFIPDTSAEQVSLSPGGAVRVVGLTASLGGEDADEPPDSEAAQGGEEDGGDEGEDAQAPLFRLGPTLDVIASTARRLAPARAVLSTALDAFPMRVELIDARLTGVPICGTLVAPALSLGTLGVEGELLCGAMRFGVTVPQPPSVPIMVEATGLDLGLLPGDTAGRASLRFELETAGQPTLRARGEVEDATWFHAAVSPETLRLDGAEVAVEVRLGRGRGAPIAVDARATIGGVLLDASVEARPEDRAWALDFDGGVTEAATCAAMWDAIPAALRPHLSRAGVIFSGSARPRVSAHYESGSPTSFDAELEGFMGDCVIEDIGAPYDPRELLGEDYVHVVTLEDGSELEVGPGTESWVALDTLPSWVPALMWLSEEVAFFTNPGFSVPLMERAVRMNVRGQRYVYGGSTVSQQLVKNLYFARDKTLARKLEEAIVVWAMEQWVPKHRILSLYVNCIEFGRGVWGIRAAATHYFGVEPWELSPLQAAFLAALKPAPWQGERYRVRGETPPDGWWPERIETLLGRLVEEGPYISAEQALSYSPYIVRFPSADPEARHSVGIPAEPLDVDVPVEARPVVPAPAFESLTEARERLGLPLGQVPRLGGR